MQGFKLDDKGDLSITNGVLDMTSDDNLTVQTLKTVLSTNKGEWFLNADEGINFSMILDKGVTEDMIRTQVNEALLQVDKELYLSNFAVVFDKTKRTAKVSFKAKRNDGTELSGEKVYG